MTTKFVDAVEKRLINDIYVKDKADFRAGAHFAQSFYLPLLEQAMAALEKITNHHNLDTSTPGEAIALASYCLSEKTLASIRAQLGVTSV